VFYGAGGQGTMSFYSSLMAILEDPTRVDPGFPKDAGQEKSAPAEGDQNVPESDRHEETPDRNA
jgi:hypothetical protein